MVLKLPWDTIMDPALRVLLVLTGHLMLRGGYILYLGEFVGRATTLMSLILGRWWWFVLYMEFS